MIRRFFTGIIILGLICSAGYFYWRCNSLQVENRVLVAKTDRLERQISSRRGQHRHRQDEVATDTTVSPDNSVQAAQQHLSNAELAISQGNIGTAVSECKLAAGDIQTASGSTSVDVRNSVGILKQRLAQIQDKSAGLWKKIGG
jgi:hypothetical protein